MSKSKQSTSKPDKKEQKAKAEKAKETKAEKAAKKDEKKKKKAEKKAKKSKPKKKKSPKKTKDKKEILKKVFDKKTIILLIIVVLGGLAYVFRGFFVAAIVNGVPISRFKILKQAEQTQGQQILDSLITEQLIQQKAKEQGISISDEELNQEIDQIKQSVEEQDQSFDQILAMQGMSVEDLKDRLRLNKIIEQLLADQVEVSEEEVTQYIEDNQDFFSEDMSDEEKQQTAREQLRTQKMNQQYQQWVQELKDEARIRNFVNYGQ